MNDTLKILCIISDDRLYTGCPPTEATAHGNVANKGSLTIIRSKRPNGEATGFPAALPSARGFDSCLGSSAMIRGRERPTGHGEAGRA